jgi:hypothetical protein
MSVKIARGKTTTVSLPLFPGSPGIVSCVHGAKNWSILIRRRRHFFQLTGWDARWWFTNSTVRNVLNSHLLSALQCLPPLRSAEDATGVEEDTTRRRGRAAARQARAGGQGGGGIRLLSDLMAKRDAEATCRADNDAGAIKMVHGLHAVRDAVAVARSGAFSLLRGHCSAALRLIACSAGRLGLCGCSALGGGRGVGRASKGWRHSSTECGGASLPCGRVVGGAAGGRRPRCEVDGVLEASSPMTHP